jgi:truncated hemoglobin YjbI
MTNTTSSSSSKAGVLQSGIAARKETLLLKLGGKDVLHKAVDTFYDQLVKEPELEDFFRDIPDVSILKWHQFNFMSVAFAPIPENFGAFQKKLLGFSIFSMDILTCFFLLL